MSATKPTATEKGFTIIELLISITLSSIIITVFVSSLMGMVKTAAAQRVQLELSQESQIALDIIERDVRMARAFETTPAYSTFVDTYGPTNTTSGWTGAWSYKGSDTNHRVLILRQSATTTNPVQVSRTPVYIQGFLDNIYAETDGNLNCTAYNAATAPTGALTYNAMLPYYVIYFVRDGNLYRRTLTDTTTPLCNTQYQKRSCPTDASRPVACKANDELIAENVASFTVTYYSQDDSSSTPTFNDINAYAQSSSSIFDEVSNVLVTLKLQKISSGTTVRSSTLSVRVSRVN